MLRADPFIQTRLGWKYLLVTFPQLKHVAGKPIYSKTCLGWECLRSKISSTDTRCGQTRFAPVLTIPFEDSSATLRVDIHPNPSKQRPTMVLTCSDGIALSKAIPRSGLETQEHPFVISSDQPRRVKHNIPSIRNTFHS